MTKSISLGSSAEPFPRTAATPAARRAWRLLLCALFGVLAALARSAPARAESKERCLEAYDAGQRLRKAGQLTRAEGELLLCGGPECPAAMHQDCQEWLDEVRASLPSVVFRAFSSAGELLVGARVSVDEGPLRVLDGLAIDLDPGVHSVRFEHAGYFTKRGRVFLAEGEQLEARDVILEPIGGSASARSRLAISSLLGTEGLPPEGTGELETPAAPEPAGRSWLPLAVSAGAGVLGSAGFAYFGLRARAEERRLDDCTPGCPARQIAGVKRDYVLSNVSLGAGLIGWVAAGALFFLQGSDPVETAVSWPRTTLHLGQEIRWEGRF